MASLRRPSAAIQRGQAHGPSQSGPRPPLPGDDDKKKNARKSKVGDKIRKRMSMRYMGAEQLTPAVPPPLPGQGDFLDSDPYGGADFTPLPDDAETGETYFNQFGSPEFAQQGFGGATAGPANRAGVGTSGARLVAEEGIRRRGAADATREEEWDLEELGKEGFDLAGYMKRTLTGADEEEKQRFKAALMRAKQGNKRELQRNVFKHYAEFVTISKEISTLENDMLELKELLGQWKDLPQLMGMEDTLAPTLDKNGNLERRRTQRNSVMDLQNLYRTQLTQLWSTVEGSQKYLPLVPGRHLVFETHNFVELNAATYKAKQSVSMFLLNDLLLIAGRRRTKGATSAAEGDEKRERGRMVAERCWVLADLVVVDVKDSGDLTNALKIRRGKEVCVYRTSKPEDKKALLGAFRQVSHELGEKKRKESEKEQERRKSMWHGDKSAGSSTTGAFALPGIISGRPLSTIGMSMSDSKDLRWIDEYGDELTMAIAMRDWEEAVKLVERGRDLLKTVSSNQAALSLLTTRLDQLTPSLISQLTHDLSSPSIRKISASKLVTLLTRLDSAELARDIFLKARTEVMLKRVRSIKCEGDISIYVSELAIVCFTVVRHTSDWYMTAFRENRMASGFVTWAKEQIETFADMFRRQVYAPNIEKGVADECIRVTASHNRKLLRDVGLDFTYVLSTLLQSDPTDSNPHPVLNNPSTIATPGPEYHLEPSPYPGTYTSYFPSAPLASRTLIPTRSASQSYGAGTWIIDSALSDSRAMEKELPNGSSMAGTTAPLSVPSKGRVLAERGNSGFPMRNEVLLLENDSKNSIDKGRLRGPGYDGLPVLPPRSDRRRVAPPGPE
ncbi:exocyst complex component EXO84 [Kwoniella heveanensis BCC8398]|uniref:Exocyst complex component EXO84 n=1 Tax=Kwoniella heveanensis BCC8398 TaxID=1296120 RepID=A0A1B9GX83_9TREE|nr:exocyst complex component EXO84 [Kwoniella heveanensis BCC8398]